jgi:mRNA-degrading endonuclease RelE of RelBE toxin-antitoxin system
METEWRVAFEIRYSQAALEHLKLLLKREQVTITDTVDRQLTESADVETRNRKRMRANPLASWELKIGNFRVYYDIEEAELTVVIIAIGIKDRDRVLIGGEEYEL